MSIQEFNSIVVNQADGLKPFAFSLTRDTDAADDLCQETLYKAFAYRDQYRTGTNIRAWLYTIMRNTFINEYRRNGRKLKMLQSVAFYQDKSENSPAISLQIREINKAIYSLPAIFKTACLLYLQGYKYQEIASRLNEPLGTIKSRIHFAKKLLQKQIDR